MHALLCILRACSNLGELDKGFEMHKNIVKFGFDSNLVVGNTLLGMYARCGALHEAIDVFKKQMFQNVVSWNALLAAFSDNGQFKEAWTYYCRMKSEGVLLDNVTYTCILKACGGMGAIDAGHELHIELTKKGYDVGLMVANTLVDFYGKCWSPVDSQGVFDMLKVPVLDSWNALLQAYTRLKLDEEALNCSQQMQLNEYVPDIIFWNSMIMCYAELGEKDKACLFFERMLEQGVLANNAVFVSILKACDDKASIEIVRRVHTKAYSVNLNTFDDAIVTTTLIDMYSKCRACRRI
ncbi:hypothetical protein L7F22_006589 [Adiantum nelumboides]|nr:hypothetical protein [Adiantum nelumboides]